jgi:hypothetical protein
VTLGSVEIVGGARLRATLKKAGADMADLKDANQAAGQMVADESRPIAPHRTGRLAASVRAARQVGRARIQAGGAAVPYAGPIHWGWPSRNIRPQPFISTAAVATEPQWLPLYLDNVQTIVDTVRGA